MTEAAPKNTSPKINPHLVDAGETIKNGIRFSSDAHVARIREEFSLPPKLIK